jgi:HK97 family phage portal protein
MAGILERIFRNSETTLANPSKWLQDFFLGGAQSSTGIVVNERNAAKFSAVYSSIRVLSESLAVLPLPVYRRLPTGGKERANDHPLYSVLHDIANEQTTSFIWRETIMNHILTYGNGYSYIQRDRGNRVVGLWILRPDKTFCERKANGELKYRTVTDNGMNVIFNFEDVLHIPGLGFDGISGQSPIAMAREAIGLGLAAEEFGGRFFGNGANAGGVLEHPGKLGEQAHKNLKSDIETKYEGLGRSHKLIVLEEGMKFNKLSIPPNEAQFLETRKFQINEIARIYRVPPHMLGDLERATFSNIEQQDIGFVKHTMLPWLKRWEQQIFLKLFSQSERKAFFAEFNVDGLLRGDIKSRFEAYQIAHQNGWYNADDIREKENDNPQPDEQGKVYYINAAMVPKSMAGQATQPQQQPNAGKGGETIQ